MRSTFLFFSIFFFILLFYISFASETFALNQKNSVPLQQLQNDSLIEVYCPGLIEDGFSQEALVKTAAGHVAIGSLHIGDCVIGQNGQQQVITAIGVKQVDKCWQITVNNETFFCGIDQLFYDTSLDDWVLIYEIGIVETEIIEKPTVLYRLTVNGEAFSVSYAELLAHNHPAIMITAAPLMASIIPAAAKAVAILGVASATLYSLFARNSGHHKQYNSHNSSSSCSTPPPEDPRNKTKYENMEQVFERAPMGRKLEKVVKRTDFNYKGSKIYQVIEDVEEWGIKKGDWLYLDRMHYDHIEVFNRSGKALRTVLNMDGTRNAAKVRNAAKRNIRQWIN